MRVGVLFSARAGCGSAEIASARAELSISYLTWSVTESPLSRTEAMPVIKGIVAAIMNFFVGTLGVLAAILVTAPIIPHTFEVTALRERKVGDAVNLEADILGKSVEKFVGGQKAAV